MTKFKTRINQSSRNSRIILANDYDSTNKKIVSQTIQNIKTLHKFLCGIKLNFHVLLPLGKKEIIRINKTAHQYGLQTIADIKLNVIGNTNHITSKTLWDFGFDAIIVNPIMGPQNLKKIVTQALGSYVFLYLFIWILTNTIVNVETVSNGMPSLLP